MKQRAFTILEIVVICVIIGILSSLAIPYFQNVMEKSSAEVCETNLKALQKALDIYIRENDEAPATLAALPQEDVDKAFAGLMQEQGAWKRRFAFFIRDMREYGLLYAASEYFPRLRCPKDTTPPIPSNPNTFSYGLNSQVVSISASSYFNNSVIFPSTMVIFDSDDGTNPVLRHRRVGWGVSAELQYYMIGVDKDGKTGCSNHDNSLYASICPY